MNAEEGKDQPVGGKVKVCSMAARSSSNRRFSPTQGNLRFSMARLRRLRGVGRQVRLSKTHDTSGTKKRINIESSQCRLSPYE